MGHPYMRVNIQIINDFAAILLHPKHENAGTWGDVPYVLQIKSPFLSTGDMFRLLNASSW
eukprot:6233641-Amphidinium_carterae.1